VRVVGKEERCSGSGHLGVWRKWSDRSGNTLRRVWAEGVSRAQNIQALKVLEMLKERLICPADFFLHQGKSRHLEVIAGMKSFPDQGMEMIMGLPVLFKLRNAAIGVLTVPVDPAALHATMGVGPFGTGFAGNLDSGQKFA